MKLKIQAIILSGISALFLSSATGQTTYTWDDGGSNERFSNSGNWDPTGVPAVGDTGNVDGFLVTIGTAGEMQTGATINLNGASTLERLSTAYSAFDGILNINDETVVQISSWFPTNNTTLNWSSTGTLELAPAGAGSQQRFFIDDGTNNAGTVVNMSAGTWDLTGNAHQDSFSMEAGTFNMTGGLMITDKRFKVGTTGGGGTFNYHVGAELRADTMGLFADAVFNMEGGSTIYIWAGFLGGFGGQDGADYWRDEMRQGEVGSNIYIDGVKQTLGAAEELVDSNFSHTQVQIEGVWFDAITANSVAELTVVIAGIVLSGSDLEITVPSQSGVDYLLETSSTMGSGTWTSVETKAGTGADLIFVVPAPTVSGSKDFYRVTAPAP